MRSMDEGVDFMDAARRRILAALADADRIQVAELPRAWPLTRVHVRALVEEMAMDGTVIRERGPAGGSVRLARRRVGRRAA